VKVLISGRNGQLGSDCIKVLEQEFEVIAPEESGFDITDRDAVRRVIKRTSPDVVLNCAAYTNVDACETERETAWRVNVEGPGNLAKAAEENGSGIIHISTDYVFDGKKPPPEPYTEEEETGPLSYYGRTKLESEEIIRGTTDNHVIIRTAWVYGINGHNFLKTMLRLALKNPKKKIKVVNDQYGSPTWSYRLSEQIKKIIETEGKGTYHAASEGYCTWYEFAEYFLKKMNIKSNIIPCSTEEYKVSAVRPGNSILDNKRLKEENISLMRDWKMDVDEFVLHFKEKLLKEVNG